MNGCFDIIGELIGLIAIAAFVVFVLVFVLHVF